MAISFGGECLCAVFRETAGFCTRKRLRACFAADHVQKYADPMQETDRYDEARDRIVVLAIRHQRAAGHF